MVVIERGFVCEISYFVNLDNADCNKNFINLFLNLLNTKRHYIVSKLKNPTILGFYNNKKKVDVI